MNTPTAVTRPGQIARARENCAMAVRYRREFDWFAVPAHILGQKHGELLCSCPQGFLCDTPGKHPRWPWREDRTPYPTARLEQEWSKGVPWNVGVLAGWRSRLACADLDNKPGYPLPMEKRVMLLKEHGWSLDTCMERTGSGGLHIYAALPEGVHVASAGKYLETPGIELFADGRFVIVPPSRNRNGRYAWVEGHAPWEIPPAALPDWVMAGLVERRVETAGMPKTPRVPVVLTDAQAKVLTGRAEELVRRAIARVEAAGGHDRYCTVKSLAGALW